MSTLECNVVIRKSGDLHEITINGDGVEITVRFAEGASPAEMILGLPEILAQVTQALNSGDVARETFEGFAPDTAAGLE